MRRFSQNTEPSGFSWAYRDLLTALLVVFIAMAALALMAVIQKPDPRIPIQGNLVVAMHWDARTNGDIDLWVKSPGDRPVGFARLAGLNCNLLRDDLGHSSDRNSQNEEMTVCRNAPAGAYAVNVMAYNVYDRRFPVRVSIQSFFSGANGSKTIFQRRVKLTYPGQELTVARFRLTGHGNLEPGTLNDIPVRLYRSE